ncbi:MAG TPA: DUF5132 domain-containing protein [Rhodopila sp.]|jgi:hypothetical protein|nr:DUF5132 domain-containing protein [Rhodopila sp.]
MALEDIFKGGNLVTGLAIGVGSAIVAPVVVPALGGLLRPAAKAVVKGGIVAYDWGRQAVAQVGEAASDMVAEARVGTQHAGEAAPAGAGQKPGEAAAV